MDSISQSHGSHIAALFGQLRASRECARVLSPKFARQSTWIHRNPCQSLFWDLDSRSLGPVLLRTDLVAVSSVEALEVGITHSVNQR